MLELPDRVVRTNLLSLANTISERITKERRTIRRERQRESTAEREIQRRRERETTAERERETTAESVDILYGARLRVLIVLVRYKVCLVVLKYVYVYIQTTKALVRARRYTQKKNQKKKKTN